MSVVIPTLPATPGPSRPTTLESDTEAFLLALNPWGVAVQGVGAQLTSLANGVVLALQYGFSTTTAIADPGAGLLRLDNATQTSATNIVINVTDLTTTNLAAMIDTFGASNSTIKGWVKLVKQSDPSKFIIFTLSAVVASGSYRQLTVAVVTSSGGPNPFSASDVLVLQFVRNGDKGDTGTLAYTYDAQTTNVQLTAADFAASTRLFRDITSGAVTQTIAALAGIANGDFCQFKNSGTGICTIDPNGAETIDGAANIKVLPGEQCIIQKSSGGFHTVGLAPKGCWIEIARATAAASATLDFANVFSSAFDEYQISIEKLRPTTANQSLWLRTSTDGVTYDAAAGNYDYAVVRFTSGAAGVVLGSGTDTKVDLNGGATIGGGAQQTFSAVVDFFKPSAAANAVMKWTGAGFSGSTIPITFNGTGVRLSAAAITSFRLLFASGTIADGDVVVRGRKI